MTRGTTGRTHVDTVVALEVLVLWPRGVGPTAATVGEASLWPVFVLVVDDRPRAETGTATPLFDLVDRPRLGNELAVVSASCRWSIIDQQNALLKVEVEAKAPERFAVHILVPARHVLGILDVVAHGATIGITTSQHVTWLPGRVDIRQALHEVVLLSCEPSAELATLTAHLGLLAELREETL
jgi:hypothetical protein